MGPIRVAIHLHTDYSFDSNFAPAEVVAAARAERLACIAITDHDEIDGALEARRCAGRDLEVIVGEEISTRDGHLIGLFLRERIAPGASAAETIRRIRAQGGLVLAPHPFSTLCDNSLGAVLHSIADRIDAVEIHNAQNPLPWQDWSAARFAAERKLAAYVGADTHVRGRLAPAWQEMPPFSTPAEFLAALRSARHVCGRFGPGYYAAMIRRHVRDELGLRPARGYGMNYHRRRAPAQAPAAGSWSAGD